jgi:3-deoxy-D-manno-octulosonic-acid transferase
VIRRLYTALFYLALPLVFLRLCWRARKNPSYRKNWAERRGIPHFRCRSSIWLHAVSLGEMVAATPLIKALVEAYPIDKIVLTTMTPTGRDQAARLAKQHPKQIRVSYVPYDLPRFIKRFVKMISPRILIIMETELWPNTIRVVHQARVPILLANARISDHAYPKYQRIQSLLQPIFKQINCVAAQSEHDLERFHTLGLDIKKGVQAGNLKYDFALPDQIQKTAEKFKLKWAPRLVWIAASTHEGEEARVLQAYAVAKKKHKDLLLILVPRHPERFDTVSDYIRAAGLSMARRSKKQPILPETDVFLGDTMGELLFYYALSDVAFVGGSLVDIGGHNILEPAALGVPIICGPYMQNSKAIVQDFLAKKALVQASLDTFTPELMRLLSRKRDRASLAKAAATLLAKNKGVLQCLTGIISWLIK